MIKKLFLVVSLTLLTPAVISCNSPRESSTPEKTIETGVKKGNLFLVANGEDFIREGFVSKDGWRLDFDRVYVTLANVTAYQTDPPFNPEKENKIQASKKVVLLNGPKTVDLAAGEKDAEPILVETVEAPAGTYNAISWKVVKATAGAAEGKTILLEGKAKKEGQTVKFSLSFDRPLEYTCGEYVGDDRKGILKAENNAQLETTFHFDHIFGDADTPADDSLNTDALGFEPLAALASNGSLEADMESVKQKLSAENYRKLEKAIVNLGHVGEGHCSTNSEQ